MTDVRVVCFSHFARHATTRYVYSKTATDSAVVVRFAVIEILMSSLSKKRICTVLDSINQYPRSMLDAPGSPLSEKIQRLEESLLKLRQLSSKKSTTSDPD